MGHALAQQSLLKEWLVALHALCLGLLQHHVILVCACQPNMRGTKPTQNYLYFPSDVARRPPPSWTWLGFWPPPRPYVSFTSFDLLFWYFLRLLLLCGIFPSKNSFEYGRREGPNSNSEWYCLAVGSHIHLPNPSSVLTLAIPNLIFFE